MIEVSGLSKRYGKLEAVSNLNFTIEGGVIGFLGPNGAGKSTTMNIITGYIPCTNGSVKVCGYNVATDPMEVKKRIGYLPETPPLYPEMTVEEYLKFVSDLKGVYKKDRADRVRKVSELTGLAEVMGRLIKNLSKGYQQRVGLAQALISKDENGPEVLILDEPTIGLDPKQVVEIRNLIKQLREGRTIVLSSHILSEISAICEKVIIINKGQIVGIGTLEDLSDILSPHTQVHATIEGSRDAILDRIAIIEGVKSVRILEEMSEENTTKYEIESERDVDIKKPLFMAMSELEMPILEIKSITFSLEEVFLQLTGKENNSESGNLNEHSDHISKQHFDDTAEQECINEQKCSNQDESDDCDDVERTEDK